LKQRAVKVAQAAASETEPHCLASSSLQRESGRGSPLARGRSDEPRSWTFQNHPFRPGI